jgi:tRNA-Thr(GGU) m(6)t(6)A37 methyltransferase TsaA
MDGAEQRAVLSRAPIGVIRSPWRESQGTPIQPTFAQGARGQVVIDDAYADALADIEGFDRIWLIYRFDRAGPFHAHVTPYPDSQAHGLLATRAPCRPNPIGMSSVRLLGRQGDTLDVADLDVLDGTPLLDVKPYVPAFDAWAGRAGWIDGSTAGSPVDDGRFSAQSEPPGGSYPAKERPCRG